MLFDALSCLDICDSPKNSVGYQNYFSVEFKPMVKDMLFSKSSLRIPVLFCTGHCKCTQRILSALGTSSEALSTCAHSGNETQDVTVAL